MPVIRIGGDKENQGQWWKETDTQDETGVEILCLKFNSIMNNCKSQCHKNLFKDVFNCQEGEFYLKDCEFEL